MDLTATGGAGTQGSARGGNDAVVSDPAKLPGKLDVEWHHDPYVARPRTKNYDVRHAPTRHAVPPLDGEEPLVDTTAAIALHSKRTERLQKRQAKKGKKNAVYSDVKSFLELPSELLLEVLHYLRPSDIFTLTRLNRSARAYISDHESSICQEIIAWRYPILTQCFPPPILFEHVDVSAHTALLSPRHQQRLVIHKKLYQHVRAADPQNTCSCLACVMAWNNLCLVLDLAHWQDDLDRRVPIPMIGRGSLPKWNSDLADAKARIVDKAIRRRLWYARVLETHLATTVRTIVRHAAVRRKGGSPVREVPAERRLFHLSSTHIASETDSFMQRSGPPSFEFPFSRDNYYTLVSYLPNRRWDEGKWIYYGDLHERDVFWAKTVEDRAAQLTQRVQEVRLPPAAIIASSCVE